MNLHRSLIGGGGALAIALTSSLVLAATPLPQGVTIQIKNFGFHDMDATVAAGATVTWKNLDGEPHTVTSTQGVFRSAALDQGDAFSFRFAKPGVYPYICSIHPQMRARITVR